MAVLELRGLGVRSPEGIELVSDATLSVPEGTILHLVGESGSGKSLTLKAIMGILPRGFIVNGDLLFRGEPLDVKRVRGRHITMVFQDPGASLDPLYTVGYHISEVLGHVRGIGAKAIPDETARLLSVVGLEPDVARLHPHSLSGGMRQRVAIALALAPNPDLILFDEPTTALDPTVEARILATIRSIVNELGVSVLMVTHDLSVVARMGGRVAVMYGGMVLETGDVAHVLESPRHPYTRALMDAAPFSGVVRPIPGDVLPPQERTGCPFHNRCPHATSECVATVTAWTGDGDRAWRCLVSPL